MGNHLRRGAVVVLAVVMVSILTAFSMGTAVLAQLAETDAKAGEPYDMGNPTLTDLYVAPGGERRQ